MLNHIDILAGESVVADAVARLADLVHDDGTLLARIHSDAVERSLQSLLDDLRAGLLVALKAVHQIGELVGSMDVGCAAARDDAFLDSRAGRVQSVLHAELLVFHFRLGRSANADNRNAACELCETLLQLLAVEIGLGLLDLGLDLRNAGRDLILVAFAVDDDCIFLLDLDGLRAA